MFDDHERMLLRFYIYNIDSHRKYTTYIPVKW